MKKNLEYYQHKIDSHNHPKFKMLRLEYSWAGEGKFWALNNIIGASDECKLNLNKGYNRSMVAFDLNFSLEEFEQYLRYLADVCKLIKYKKGIVTTDTTQENYVKVHGERTKARSRKINALSVSSEKFARTNPELPKSSPELPKSSPERNKKSNQTKVNETKLNKIKSNQTKVNETKTNSGDGRIFLKKEKTGLNGQSDLLFNKFWKFYPRREGDVMKVREVFINLIRSEAEYENLIMATRNYNNLTNDRQLKYVKLPINFLENYKDFINV